MWRYVWRKSPIILRLSFWMILDSKTCLCQMSDHEKSLIIHEQCLWNRPFCQVITNWQCSAFLLLFLSMWSFSDQFSHQIITALGHKIIAHAQMSIAFSHLLITWSTPDQCLIISWSMFDQRLIMINALSMLNHRLIIRLLLSLSCSVSLWLESAQRSLERNIVSCEFRITMAMIQMVTMTMMRTRMKEDGDDNN